MVIGAALVMVLSMVSLRWCVHEIARRWPITPHHQDLIPHYAPIPRDNLDSVDELYIGDNFPQTG
jgi:hypothetical protein